MNWAEYKNTHYWKELEALVSARRKIKIEKILVGYENLAEYKEALGFIKGLEYVLSLPDKQILKQEMGAKLAGKKLVDKDI